MKQCNTENLQDLQAADCLPGEQMLLDYHAALCVFSAQLHQHSTSRRAHFQSRLK